MRRLACWLLSCASAVGVSTFVTQSHGQDLAKDTSLRFVPYDADIYIGSFKHSEQWKRFLEGPVCRKFLNLPLVTQNWKQFQDDWKARKAELAQAKMVIENPNFKEAMAFLKDICSEEAFFFADKNLSEWTKASNEFSQAMQSAVMAGQMDESDDAMLEMVDEWIDRLKDMHVPTIAFGAKYSDEDLAITKVDQLEAAIQLPLMAVPQLQELASSIKRVEDNRGSRLTMELSGKMIPWESLPTNDTFDEESLEHLQEVMSGKTFAVTIGTLDKYFVFAITESSKDILQWGKGKGLAEHADLSPAIAASNKPLTAVSYVSDVLSNANWGSQLDGMISNLFAQMSGPMRSMLDDDSELHEFFDDVEEDLEWLDGEIGKIMPPIRGQTSFSALTSSGWEVEQHLRTPNVLIDGTKPLEGLQHVGDAPLMMAVTKMADHPEYFQLLRQVVGRAKSRFDEAAELDWSELDGDPEEFQKAKMGIDLAWPFLVRMADIWETKFLPGFDGEHGVVISSGNLAAKQWAKDMPPSDVDLPLPEIAWIAKARNQTLLREGGKEVFGVFDSILSTIKSLNPEAVPEGYSIPRPTKTSTGLGDKFGYPIPDNCPAPKEMMPHALFTDNYLIFGFSSKQSEVLAKGSILKVGDAILKTDKPLASASYVHVGEIMKAMKPWVRYGFMQSGKKMDENLMEENAGYAAEYEVNLNHILSLWDVLGSIGEFSSVTTMESNGQSIIRSVYQPQSLP